MNIKLFCLSIILLLIYTFNVHEIFLSIIPSFETLYDILTRCQTDNLLGWSFRYSHLWIYKKYVYYTQNYTAWLISPWVNLWKKNPVWCHNRLALFFISNNQYHKNIFLLLNQNSNQICICMKKKLCWFHSTICKYLNIFT